MGRVTNGKETGTKGKEAGPGERNCPAELNVRLSRNRQRGAGDGHKDLWEKSESREGSTISPGPNTNGEKYQFLE